MEPSSSSLRRVIIPNSVLKSFCPLDTLCCVLLALLCPTLCDPMDHCLQAPLSMGFSRQGYWSGLPFPSPGLDILFCFIFLTYIIRSTERRPILSLRLKKLCFGFAYSLFSKLHFLAMIYLPVFLYGKYWFFQNVAPTGSHWCDTQFSLYSFQLILR